MVHAVAAYGMYGSTGCIRIHAHAKFEFSVQSFLPNSNSRHIQNSSQFKLRESGHPESAHSRSSFEKHSLECCFPPTPIHHFARRDFNEIMLCVMRRDVFVARSQPYPTRESSSSLDCGIDVVDKLLLIPNAHRQKSRLSNIFIAHTQEVSLCTNGVELEPYRRHNSIHRYCI